MKDWQSNNAQHRHIWNMSIITVQYLCQEIGKSTGHLIGIFKNTDLLRQGQIFNSYMTCTQINISQTDNQEGRMLAE